jgi:hypothetical protein
LPTALPVDELQHYLNPYACPYFETIAVSGSGVITTFKAAVNLVVAQVIKNL